MGDELTRRLSISILLQIKLCVILELSAALMIGSLADEGVVNETKIDGEERHLTTTARFSGVRFKLRDFRPPPRDDNFINTAQLPTESSEANRAAKEPDSNAKSSLIDMLKDDSSNNVELEDQGYYNVSSQ